MNINNFIKNNNSDLVDIYCGGSYRRSCFGDTVPLINRSRISSNWNHSFDIHCNGQANCGYAHQFPNTQPSKFEQIVVRNQNPIYGELSKLINIH